jgi:hypothetical protein
MRRSSPHQSVTEFRLCKEFGWTIQQLYQQPSKKVSEFLVILSEMDQQTQEEIDKAKREVGRR